MIYLILVSILWAFSFGLIKNYLVGIDPFFLAFMRLASALFVFLFFMKKFPFLKIIKICFIGAIQFGCMYYFYLRSYQYLSAHQVALLTVTTPLFIVLIHAILERKIGFNHLVAALLAVIASAMIVYQNSDIQFALKGVLFVQASNFFFSLGQIIYKRYFPHSKTESLNEFFWLVLGALIFITMVLIHEMLIEQKSFQLTQIKPISWLVMIYLGSIATGIGFYFWNKGANLVKNAELAVLNNLKVPIAVLVSWLIFKEKVDLMPVLASIILFGISLRISNKT